MSTEEENAMPDARPGVYRYHAPGDPPVIYFDGTNWLLPGWEVPMQVTEEAQSYSHNKVPAKNIGRLLWAEADEHETERATGESAAPHEHDDD